MGPVQISEEEVQCFINRGHHVIYSCHSIFYLSYQVHGAGYYTWGIIVLTLDPRVSNKRKIAGRYLKGTISIGLTRSDDAGDGDDLITYGVDHA